MPLKRYGLAFGLIALYLIKTLGEVILLVLLRPDILESILARNTASPLASIAYILISISVTIYILRRLYFVLLKNDPLIIGGIGNQLHGVQKVGIFLLNVFYASLGLAIVALIGALFLATSGGSSGVPAGIAFVVAMFFLFLAVFLIETGNYINKRKAIEAS